MLGNSTLSLRLDWTSTYMKVCYSHDERLERWVGWVHAGMTWPGLKIRGGLSR